MKHPFESITLQTLRERSSEKWRSYPGDVLPAFVAEMDCNVAPSIRAALQRALDDGDLGYAAPKEMAPAFASFASNVLNWDVDERHVFAIPDVMSGVSQALRLFTQPGDGVVINPPVYPPFFEVVASEGRRIVEVPLAEDEAAGWIIDLDSLEQAFSAGAKAYLLCNPHNPVGRAWSRTELQPIAQLAERYGVAVISDEIHAPLTMPGVPFVPFSHVAPETAAVVTLISASKGWNIPGLKCGVLIAGASIAERMRVQLHAIPTEIESRIGHLGVIASIAAFREGAAWLAELRAYLDGNRAELQQLLASHVPGVRYRPQEATYLAWLDCRALQLAGEPSEHFLKHGRVALYRGSKFGSQGSGFVRLNMGTSREILAEVVRRMEAALSHR
jgi:cystathionine beta-lyase